MGAKPFLKWAGGKRWLVERDEFIIPYYRGTYIEPFLGGGAVFFSQEPKTAILSDINSRLMETYQAIKEDWFAVWRDLLLHQKKHSKEHFYKERDKVKRAPYKRAAQFIYLNRACWNGLYRENLKGRFNVPIGTKKKVVFDYDNFEEISRRLQRAEMICCDFEETIEKAREGDLVFVDPPYTTAHNFNGFAKYNQRIFSWRDQVRLSEAIQSAIQRGAAVLLTNAAHDSIKGLYADLGLPLCVKRHSVIAGSAEHRDKTSEYLYVFHP